MKDRVDSDDHLPLEKRLKTYDFGILIASTFNDDNSYYPQVFLEECL